MRCSQAGPPSAAQPRPTSWKPSSKTIPIGPRSLQPDKIKVIKAFSSRNRFFFIFEDPSKLSAEHRRVLEADGVNCLSFDQLEAKLSQLDFVLVSLKAAVDYERLPPEHQNWRKVVELFLAVRRQEIYDFPSRLL